MLGGCDLLWSNMGVWGLICVKWVDLIVWDWGRWNFMLGYGF